LYSCRDFPGGCLGGNREYLPFCFSCLTTGSSVPAAVLVRGILSPRVPPPRTPLGTAQPADPLLFLGPEDIAYDIVQGVDSWFPGGAQDSGGTKFVQQNGWENDKNGPEKCRTGRWVARWLRQGKTIKETIMTDNGRSRTRPGQPLADISGGCQWVTLKRPEKHRIILRGSRGQGSTI
jgi:hypothetical protein